ncbi:hypothetical protein PMAYCL1PPCAC_01821, partial [Pristionchus mayeri]
SMSLSPGNVGRPGTSESPEEQRPVKTRYGRIVVPKGDLPGENLVPKDRRKKVVVAKEPAKAKRKYTKRKKWGSEEVEETIVTASTGKKMTAVKGKVDEPMKEVPEVPEKEIKEEVLEMESEEEQCDAPPEPSYRAQMAVPEPPVVNTYVNFVTEENKNEACGICGMVMQKYKIELHKLDNHPEYAPYECLSCRIRSFFDYWELKEHYKICSNDRIASESNREAVLFRQVVEAAFFRKLYQPVECPLCHIWLGTFFDLDVHFTAHGLASMDSKFGCDGCRLTFVSVDALKKHLTRQNTPHQSQMCFNTGRVLNKEELEELMKRYTEEERRDCIRKFDYDTYVLAPPKIVECAKEAKCAYCDQRTRAYALLKTDLSNLIMYGLECSEEEAKKVVQKLKRCRNDRVCVCRHHFQWRNWVTKKVEGGSGEEGRPKSFPQTLIKRKTDPEYGSENADGIAVVSQARVTGGAPSFTGGQSCSGETRTKKEIKVEEVDEEYEEMLFDNSKEVKEEEFDWDEMDQRERNGEDEEMDFDVDDFDFHDDHRERNGRGRPALPQFMDKQKLDEKVSASMKSGYNCPVCQTSFSDLNDLHGHGDIHPERLRYVCADCPDKSYPNPGDVFKHFDEKKKSAVAAFYSYKVIVQTEGSD